MEFCSSDHMWAFLTKHKGKKFSSNLAAEDRPVDPNDSTKRQLWHNIDKTADELALGRKGLFAKNKLVAAFAEVIKVEPAILAKAIDSTRENGSVIVLRRLLPNMPGTTPIKIFEKKPTGSVAVAPLAQEFLDSINVKLNLQGLEPPANDPPRE